MAAANEGTRRGTCGYSEQQGGQPEEQVARQAGCREARCPSSGGTHEYSRQEHVSDAAQLVRRGVFGPLLVVIVEPVDLCNDDESRQRQAQEKRQLRHRDVDRHEKARHEQKRDAERQGVCAEKCAPEQPSPPSLPRVEALVAEDRPCLGGIKSW